MYSSLGTPVEAVVESIRAMKNITSTMMSGEDAGEAGAYFDYLISVMHRATAFPDRLSILSMC